MRDPDSAIDCADADRAIAPRQNFSGRTFEALLLMRSIEEASFAEQGPEDAWSAIRRADLSHDQGGAVLHPVDGTVGLPHRRAQTAAQSGRPLGRHIGQLLRLPGAGSELPRFDSGDRLDNAAHGGLGDLTTIEAALRGRIGHQGKLVRGPDRAGIEFVRCLQDRYAPDLLVVGDGPVERGGAPIALDAGVHDQAEMARPDLLRNSDFQHRRNDQIRRLAGDSGDHCSVRRRATDANFVATLAKLDPQTLAEAVVGRCQKENSHGFSPLFSACWHEPEPVFSRADGRNRGNRRGTKPFPPRPLFRGCAAAGSILVQFNRVDRNRAR